MKTDESIGSPLPAALLAEIEAIAAREHRAAEEVVREALATYLKDRSRSDAVSLSPAEKSRLLKEWANSHSYTPPLSDEAIRRENLIRDER